MIGASLTDEYNEYNVSMYDVRLIDMMTVRDMMIELIRIE